MKQVAPRGCEVPVKIHLDVVLDNLAIGNAD